MKELLRMENITKRFGPGYSQRLSGSEAFIPVKYIHCLAKTARKSTLMNVLIGLTSQQKVPFT